ncbi:discoidin domain-containing protein [Paenibacillus wynnii]|uniref:Licheninase n=1 Tax=Paenibacillus wynnii TaxID=268407 RepID=A0A098MDX8_9BACL|nr:discoidin domain-containing protein [Paenibacillus wynnii]KGE20770.1 hypothetical protein PWYN_00900 [Paenibacillus wynnii]
MRQKISIAMIAILVVNLLSGIGAMAQTLNSGASNSSSTKWAGKAIDRWTEAGIFKGDAEGSFHPEQSLTRAQLAAMLNRLFGFTKSDPTMMTDVAEGSWYAADLRKAVAAGYMQGFPDSSMHPNDLVTRQDAAVMLTRIFQLGAVSGSDAASSFTDSSSTAAYAREAISVMASNAYFSGYADGSLRPAKVLSRAEMAVMLDKMIGLYVSEHGSFLSESGLGSMVINAPNVSVKDHVSGANLFLTERAGKGLVTLENVQVKGETYIAGGVTANLSGTFGKVNLKGQSVIQITSGSVDELTLNGTSNITIGSQATVKRLEVTANGKESKLTVSGAIGQADIRGDGVTLNNSPIQKGESLSVSSGQVKILSQGNGTAGSNGSGGSPGGSGSNPVPGDGSSGNPVEEQRIDLIGDGHFTNDLGAWKAFWGNDETGTSTGTLTAVGGELRASLQAIGSSPGSVEIKREGLALTSGTVYTVSFDARASVSRKINVLITDGTKNVATLRSYVLTPEARTYTYSFTMQAESSAAGKISFELGTIGSGVQAPVNVFFDNVKLTALKASIADKTELNAAIVQVYALKEMDYTPATWSNVQSALITAKEISFASTSTKLGIDQALVDLKAAIAALVSIQRAAGLSSISFADGAGHDLQAALTPAFREGQYEYVLGVRSDVTSVVLEPKLAAGNTLSLLSGATGTNGMYTANVRTGKNEVSFEVAEEGKVSAVYHFNIMKEQPGEVRRNPEDWELTWNDEFNGDQIDTTKWNFVNQGGGFGNHELEYYTSRNENARIEKMEDGNGALVIEARKEKYQGQDYTSAKLFSQNKGDWTYGKYEVRAKLPKSQGIWPAIWMMPTDYNLYGPWPGTGEIDIMELIGSEPATSWGTLHYGLPWKYSNSSYQLPGTMDFSQDYHTFSIEWEPGEIRWYVDGIFFQRQNDWYTKRDGESAPYTWPAPFDQDFYLQLNVAVGGDWPGAPDNTTIVPSRMMVDYVKVYKLKDGLEYRDPGNGPASTINVPTPRPESGAGGLIYNGKFDQGTNRMGFWNFSTDSTATATSSVGSEVSNREFKASILDGGSSETAVKLSQIGIPLVKGKQYQVSFKARASGTDADVNVNVLKEGTPDSSYSGLKSFQLNSEMKLYTFIFTMDATTDNNSVLNFYLGQNTGEIYVDDVKLITYNAPQFQTLEAEDYANALGYEMGEGWISPSQSEAWIQYNTVIPAEGDYAISYRIATNSDTAKLTFMGQGQDTRTINLPNTGGVDQWKTLTDLVHLKAGTQLLILSGEGYRLDSITLARSIVKNGSLDNDTKDWDLWVQNVDGAVLSTEQGGAKLEITAQGDDFWGTQLSQLGVPLYKGKNYRVSFVASSTVNRKLRLTIDDPITNSPYALYESVSLTTQPRNYSFDFSMTGTTNLNSRIDFNLGKIGTAAGIHDVHLDQVYFTEIPAVEQSASVSVPLAVKVPGDLIQVKQADGFTGVTVSAGRLEPEFNSEITDYTVKVAAGITSIDLTPILAGDNEIESFAGAVHTGNLYSVALAEGDNPVSFIINQPGRVPKAYTVHMIRTPLNLAKGRTVTATSGNGTAAVDGDMTTRWESAHSDPQSLTVDLGDRYNLTSLQLNWESSRATAYSLEVSNDKTNWIRVYSTTTGSGPVDLISIPEQVTSRYIRLTGTERISFGGARYGYSLFEIEAKGEPYAGDSDFRAYKGELADIIAAAGTKIQSDYTEESWLSAVAVLTNANVVYTKPAATQTEVNSSITSLTEALAGLVKLTKADGLTGLTVSQGALSPQFNQDTAAYSLIVDYSNATLDFTPTLAPDNVMEAVYGAVASGSDPQVYATNLQVGHNEITFTVSKPGAQLKKNYRIDVIRLSEANAALHQTAVASSGNAAAATDGNEGTRWESPASDPQWIYVDLGSSKTLTAVKLKWETASAKSYKIQVSDTPEDESSWTDAAVFSQEGLPQAGRTDLIAASGTGRYVRMYGVTRNTPYGYSIFEFGVYTTE